MKRYRSWLLAASFLVLVLSIAYAWSSISDDTLSASPSPEPSSTPTTLQELENTQSIDPMGIELNPVREDFVPDTTGEEAIDVAAKENPVKGAATIEATLAAFSNAQFEDDSGRTYKKVPVWIVTYTGICVEGHGPKTLKQRCVATEENVVIDATDGSFIMTYSHT